MSSSAKARSKPVRVVFLDDGGVLNDNERRAPEWRRLLGEFFAPRLGGTPDAWGAANTIVFEEIWRDWQAAQSGGADVPVDWFERQDPRWLAGMCERVDVPVPADIAETVRASKAYVIAHIDCAFPDAAPAVRSMRDRGVTVHMATGMVSVEIARYLERMGIRGCVDRLYGPDLIGTHKTSRRYYERIVEDSRVDPRTAIVVDDSAVPLEWADAVGLRTVHLDRRGTGSRFARIGSLDQLLPLLG